MKQFLVILLLTTVSMRITDVCGEDLPLTPEPVNPIQTGIASWYSYGTEKYPHLSDTFASCAFNFQYKDYKKYKVCNLANDKCVICTNNDWMRNDKRLVDLSNYAFSKIGNLSRGLLQVSVQKVE